MNARNNGIGNILGANTDALLSKKAEDIEREPNEDSIESLNGDGRFNRHQVYACMVVDDSGSLWFIPYGSLGAQKVGKFQGKTFSLTFQDDDGKQWKMTLTGVSEKSVAFQKVIDRIAAGKRELIRPCADSVPSIKFEEVKS